MEHETKAKPESVQNSGSPMSRGFSGSRGRAHSTAAMSTYTPYPMHEHIKNLPQVNYEKILENLTSKYSFDFYDRHCSLLNRVAKRTKNGVPLKDVDSFAKIIEICGMRVKTSSKCYIPPLKELIYNCSLPFIESTGHLQSKCTSNIGNLMSTIGSCMHILTDVINNAKQREAEVYELLIVCSQTLGRFIQGMTYVRAKPEDSVEDYTDSFKDSKRSEETHSPNTSISARRKDITSSRGTSSNQMTSKVFQKYVVKLQVTEAQKMFNGQIAADFNIVKLVVVSIMAIKFTATTKECIWSLLTTLNHFSETEQNCWVLTGEMMSELIVKFSYRKEDSADQSLSGDNELKFSDKIFTIIIDILWNMLEFDRYFRKNATTKKPYVDPGDAKSKISYEVKHPVKYIPPSERQILKSKEQIELEEGRDGILDNIVSLPVMVALKNTFIYLHSECKNHFQKALRNEILIVTTILVQRDIQEQNLMVESKFLHAIILYCIHLEMGIKHGIVKKIVKVDDPLDFELKLLMLNIISILAAGDSYAKYTLHSVDCNEKIVHQTAMNVLVQEDFLHFLLLYIDGNTSARINIGQQMWSSHELFQLKLKVLQVMEKILPKTASEYKGNQGNTRLLDFLEDCIYGEDIIDKIPLMEQCLKVILSVVSEKDERIIEDFGDEGAIGLLLQYLISHRLGQWTQCEQLCEGQDQLACDCLSNDSNCSFYKDRTEVNMRSVTLNIIGKLCRNDNGNKEIFGRDNGVEAIIPYLKFDPILFNNQCLHTVLILSAVECVWNTVVGNDINQENFCLKGGLYALADLLDKMPASMFDCKSAVMGVLLDLLEFEPALEFLKKWSSEKDVDRKIGNLLTDLWESENQRLGFKYDGDGCITDLSNPLVGTKQIFLPIDHKEDLRAIEKNFDECININPGINSSVTYHTVPAQYPSRAVLEVSENMRAKIYSIFTKIGFEGHSLTLKQNLSLTVIEQYLDFKLGETWHEISSELTEEMIVPVEWDMECIREAKQANHRKAITVSRKQAAIKEQDIQGELVKEQECFDLIKKHHLMEEKAQESFDQYLKRTSDIQGLREYRERKVSLIQSSRVPISMPGFEYEPVDQYTTFNTEDGVPVLEHNHVDDMTAINLFTYRGGKISLDHRFMKLDSKVRRIVPSVSSGRSSRLTTVSEIEKASSRESVRADEA